MVREKAGQVGGTSSLRVADAPQLHVMYDRDKNSEDRMG